MLEGASRSQLAHCDSFLAVNLERNPVGWRSECGVPGPNAQTRHPQYKHEYEKTTCMQIRPAAIWGWKQSGVPFLPWGKVGALVGIDTLAEHTPHEGDGMVPELLAKWVERFSSYREYTNQKV